VLYRRFGFYPAGVRKNYYAETNEDALVMWVDDIATPDYQERLGEIEIAMSGSTVLEGSLEGSLEGGDGPGTRETERGTGTNGSDDRGATDASETADEGEGV
jgi:hypothetical protein